MLAGFHFPQEFSRLGVDGVHARQHIREVDGVLGRALSLDGGDDRCSSNTGIRTERPVDAAGLRIE